MYLLPLIMHIYKEEVRFGRRIRHDTVVPAHTSPTSPWADLVNVKGNTWPPDDRICGGGRKFRM